MQELTIKIKTEDTDKVVRQIALKTLDMSSAQFKRAKFQGALLLDGEPVHADRRVTVGQTLVIRVPDAPAAPVAPSSLQLTVAYEDDDLLVVDKPAPLPSVGSPRQSGETLENAVCTYLGGPDGFIYRPVNRLDKGTSGLMVVAKHAHAQQYLQRRLHSDNFIREYLAVCDGIPKTESGVIDAPIRKADGASIRRIVSADGRPARTKYHVERTGKGRCLVRLRLFTGRTHQIRVHLQSIGCPVTGDFLYGAEHPLLSRRFALHSAFLELTTLQKKHIWLQSAPPDAFNQLLLDQP